MIRMDVAERRRRLAVRHGLGGQDRPEDPLAVARRLVALHSTDPATVFLAVRARTASLVTPAKIEDSMYERRELIRMLAMRRTVFVVPAEMAPLIQVSTADRIASRQRTLLLRLLSDAGVAAEPEAWLAELERSVLGALADRGATATAAELAATEPRLRTSVLMAAGKPYEARQNITSRVLLVLAAQGQIIRGRPVGSWLSQQYRWALAAHWLSSPPGSPGTVGPPCPPSPSVSSVPPGSPRSPGAEASACAELARQWLTAYGPAPLTDLKWWTGWTMTQVKKTAAALGVVEVQVGAGTGDDARTGVVLPDDLDATPAPVPWVALLPALDPTVLGWSDRSWFLGPHGPALFDNTGNAGPTIWLDGRVVGGWAQRRDGEVVVWLLEDVGADATALVLAEAARVAAWLADVRVIPRFRTPP